MKKNTDKIGLQNFRGQLIAGQQSRIFAGQTNNQQVNKVKFSWVVLFSVLLVLFFIFSCSNKVSDHQAHSNDPGFDRFVENFKNPPASYSPAPLFVWNNLVTKEELDFQINELKDKGFGGVFVHPRPGMVNEYLSDNWFDLFGYTVKRCKELGIGVWIYDENSYPSGFAGGYVPEQMPSSYNEGQGLKGKPADALPEDLSPFEIILKKENGKWTDLTGKRDRLPGKAGEYYLFEKTYYAKSPWFGGFSYVDLLKPGVTEKFIDITFKQGYEKYFPEEMGQEIKGVFSDEPGIYAPDSKSIRWTPGLFDFFKKKCGYDLKTSLPCLYEETGNWRKVRYDYYKTLLQLFTGQWSKPMSEYCDRHGMSWTGHYWEHEWPDPYQGPDNMAMYVWHQIPAIDMLYNDFNETRCNKLSPNHWPQAQFGNVRSVRELSSVANQLGKKRSLCETYGGCGWDLSFNDMKRLGDWEFALGVNFLCQHLVDLSVKGARKYDYPPSFSYQEPWWQDFKYINSYFARLSYALSSGEQLNHVLVIEPTTTTWMYAARGKVMDRIVEIGKSFHAFIHQLEKLQVEYDLGSENVIEGFGSVDDGKIRVGKRDYKVVVIPPGCETLDKHTVSLLQSFLQKGGRVLSFETPVYTGGQDDNGVFQELKALPGWITSSGLNDSAVQNELFFCDWKVLENDSTSGKLYHHRRILPDGQLFFAVNSDKNKNASGVFELKGNTVVKLNPFTGEASAYPVISSRSGKLRLKIDLYPSESILLYVLNETKNGYSESEPRALGVFSEIPIVPPATINASGKNVLAIDFCDLKLKDSVYHDLHVLDAGKRVFKAHGFEAGNPWNTMVQFRSETLKRDTFPKGTGFSATYSFSIDQGVDFSAFEAVIEGDNPAPQVDVNGIPVALMPGRWWLDRSFLVYPIGKSLKKGINQITLTINPMSVMAEVEPIYVLGNFCLESTEKGWKITLPRKLSLGSWKEQGWPFYAKSVDYSQNVRITGPGNYRVQLKQWNGTVAEVLVNGEKAGIIFRQPYILDVSDQLKTGANTITVRVIGSNRNLFGPFHGNLAVGLAAPSQWSDIEKYPTGSQYQQFDYGLFDDFILEKEVTQ